MLLRFVVSNFLSFSEEVDFNMLPGSFRTHSHHVYNNGKVEALKSAAIYGANGAGKSNLIKAVNYLQLLVIEGGIYKSINHKKFKLDSTFHDKPSNFEIEFTVEKKVFSYGLSIDNNIILEEWLYESGVAKEDKLIFNRTYSAKTKKPKIQMASKYLKSKKANLLIELLEENLLKNNQLLLGKKEELKIKDIEAARNWIVDMLVIDHPGTKGTFIPPISIYEDLRKFTNTLLETFDTGVKAIDIESVELDRYFGEEDHELKAQLKQRLESDSVFSYSTDKEDVVIIKDKDKESVIRLITLHNDEKENQVVFNLSEESDGTLRLLDFITAAHLILQSDVTFIIDEIDQSLHPTVLKAFIQKLMNDPTSKGQLIFTTHESNLLDLDIFRQDEIWFVEKDKHGSTKAYSLSEFKPRTDIDIRKGYLNGRYGAIPFTAKLEDLNWSSYAEKE